MSRVFLSAAVFTIIALTPSGLAAQKEPERTKELKDAERFIASAMLAGDSAEARARLERALKPLEEGRTKNPDNALVWFASGQVFAGLNETARADSAFDRAEALYPPIAADVRGERLKAWNRAFESAVHLMDAKEYPAAIAHLERAEAIYADRPESKLNLGALYASAGESARAEAAYRAVLELTSGPAAASLQAEEAAQWKRFGALAKLRVAEMLGARGVEAFNTERYDDAAQAFREANKLNPHSRDYNYNLAQSLFARARDIEAKLEDITDKKSAEAKKLTADLQTNYAELEQVVSQTRAVDPNNEDLFQLLMRSYRVRGELAAEAAAKARYQKSAGDLMKDHQALKVVVTDLAAEVGLSEATVRGTLRNVTVAPGSPITLTVSMLGLDGSSVGEQEVVVNAPAAKEEVKFQAVVKTTGDVAGWKYVVK
jgi:tetratricopeptide (TPR) repeat protein